MAALATHGLRKVYHDKHPEFEVRIEKGMQFRGDTGDFLELAGNLLDNACKYGDGQVRLEAAALPAAVPGARPGLRLSVGNDGTSAALGEFVQRGHRGDEQAEGNDSKKSGVFGKR